MLESSGMWSYGGSKRLEVHYEELEKKEMTYSSGLIFQHALNIRIFLLI